MSTLTKADRCDACGSARATVRTLHASGELLWCTHHYGAKERSLAASGCVIVEDVREAVKAEEAEGTTPPLTPGKIAEAGQ